MARTVEQTLGTLRALQSVDDRLGELRDVIAGLSLRVDDHKTRVAQLDDELKKKAGELRNDEKNAGLKELELRVVQEKIDKLREQLRTLNSNKQYTAMTAEISGHEAESSRKEDEALAVMDRIEDTRSAMAQIREQVKEAEEAVRAEETAMAREVRNLSGEIRELTAQRQGLVQQLDRHAAERYEKISHSKGGKAVVAVRDGVCQGCSMGVTKQTITRLWAKKELMPCPNCARIMYLEGEVQ